MSNNIKKFIPSSTILAFQIARFFFRLLPTKILLKISGLIGYISSYFNKKETVICENQLKQAKRHLENNTSLIQSPLNKILANPQSVKNFPKQVFSHAGAAIGELLIMDRLLSRKADDHSFEHITITGQEIALKIKAQQQAAILLSAHIGCFELLAAAHQILTDNLVVIGRTPNYLSIAKLLSDFRKSHGVNTIWRNDNTAAIKLMRAIKDKQFLAFLIDQDIDLENGFAKFFGLNAATPIAPIRLALKFNLPIYTAFIVRSAPTKHHIFFELIEYDPENPQSTQQILETYSQRLESLIYRFPDQWIWWHRRWRRRPGIDYQKQPEKLRSTGDYITWLNSEPTNE